LKLYILKLFPVIDVAKGLQDSGWWSTYLEGTEDAGFRHARVSRQLSETATKDVEMPEHL